MTTLLSPVVAYLGDARADWVRIRNREFDRVRGTSSPADLPRWAAHCYRWEDGGRRQPPKLADRALFVGDDAVDVRAAALGWCPGQDRVERFLYENRDDLQARGCIA
jgi:hypothetical protein